MRHAIKSGLVRGTVLCCLLLSSLLPDTTALAQAGEQEQKLQERLFASQAARRSDMIRDARQRLALVDPEHPEILVLDMQDALKELDLAEQERLLALVRQQGDYGLQQRLQALVRLAQADGKMALQQARLLAAGGQFEAAVKAYQSLFANQPPVFELRLEYWKTVANLQSRKTEAMQQLYQLNLEYPGNAELQLLLGRLMLASGQEDSALQTLHSMQVATAADRDKAAELEYGHLTRLPVSARSVAALEDFVRRYPRSTLHGAAEKNLAAQKQLLANPGWQAASRGRTLLEQGRYAAAEPLLRQGLRAYPDDGNLHGALAHALMNLGRHQEAERHFAQATGKLAKRTGASDIPVIESEAAAWLAKWESLRLRNQGLLAISRGDAALQTGDLAAARSAYLRARQLRPNEVTSYLRLHELELQAGDEQAALAWLQQVQKRQPRDDRVIYAAVGFYRERDPAQARAILERLPAHMRGQFASLRLRLVQEQLSRDIEQALAGGGRERALQLQQRAFGYSPEDPWIAYRLANLLADMDRTGEADQVFQSLLQKQGSNPEARYAHGLYLASLERDEDALQTLARIDRSRWSRGMHDLQARIARRLRLQQAETLFVSGRHQQAIDLLLQEPQDDQHAQVAGWYQDLGQPDKAATHYAMALELEPGHVAALIGLAELRHASGHDQQAASLLRQLQTGQEIPAYLMRRAASLWSELGERERAIALYEQLLEQAADDAQGYRDLARLYRKSDPQRALDYYARGLAAAGELSPAALSPLDLPALTAATRQKEEDDWLARSLKKDTEALYRQSNTSIQVQQDFGWRSDSGAKGLSDLKRHTTIVRLDTPVADGVGFIQAEHVRLRSKRPNSYLFGLCSKVKGDCYPGSQNASGNGLAFGWQGANWSWDLGHSPFGFRQKNWLGGITYSSHWRQLGYDLTLSRRPMSNSVLSYAGAVDPVSGTGWGGVTANGVTLGLSYDQGGAGGVWASFGAHKMSGKHVQDNQRLSAMAGYYHRLIDEVDRRMRVGLTLMHWRYDKGLDEYTLGQGGYYSPQRYYSIGVPFSYAWRNYNWSVLFESSVSWSTSSYSGGDRLYVRDADWLITNAGHEVYPGARLRNDSSSSSGWGVRSRLLAERRLYDHWVLGGGFDWGRSKDYSPSHAFMYLRYVFKPWRGNLKLPVEPLTPYADWK